MVDLFNAITVDDILLFLPDGSIRYRGKRLDEAQVNELQESAEKFANSTIWKLLSDDAKYNANLKMYEESHDYNGMMFGKAMLYNLDILSKRMEQLSNLK